MFAGTGSATVTVDITERKRAEESLRVDHSARSAVIENTSDNIWSIDRNYRLLVINSVFRRNYGGAAGHETAPGEAILGAFEPAVQELWRAQYDRVKSGGECLCSLRWDRWCAPAAYLKFSSIRSARQAARCTGVAVRSSDITERVRAQEALRHAHDQLRLATDAAEIGIWVWDLESERLEWDERLFAIYEVPSETRRSARYCDFWRRAPASGGWGGNGAFALGGTSRRGEAWGGEFRIVLPGGRIRYIQCASNVEHDRTGKALRMIGINRDITEQKTYEQYLADAAAVLDAACGGAHGRTGGGVGGIEAR